MSKYIVQQVRLTHRGREFHFVSYEGQPENRKANRPATDPAWFLMVAGRRWEVMPHQLEQEDQERNRLLAAWLEQRVFEPTV